MNLPRVALSVVLAGLVSGLAALAQGSGDPARGRSLVESNACFDCHRIDQRGSRVGPDLSDIGTRRTPERLQQALLDPDQEVLFENRYVRFVTKDGTTVTGRLLNQDALSVQLMTPKEELKTFLRAGIRDYTIVDKGLMTYVAVKLSEDRKKSV
jgi:putative heme-binding domain-containing protein